MDGGVAIVLGEVSPMRSRICTFAAALTLLASAPMLAGWNEGVAAFKAKNYQQAEKEFAAIAHERPDWAGGFLMLGRTQLLLNKANDALTSLRKSYDLDPSNLETQLALAQAYLSAHRPTDASQLLGKINPAGIPKERQGLFDQLQAKAAADSGNTDRAAAALERAAAASPNDATVQYNYGVSALNAGNTSAAVSALERAVRFDPRDPAKQKVLVQALVRQARESRGPTKDASYSRAAVVAKGLVAKSATYENLLLLGETQLGAGQYDAAVVTLSQAIAKNGDEWLPQYYAGQAQTALMKYSMAETSLQRALTHATAAADKQRIWKQLGFVYEKQKSFNQAKTAYQNGGDSTSAERVEKNAQIAENNRQADEEAKKLAEIKAQQEKLRKQIQDQGGAPPPFP